LRVTLGKPEVKVSKQTIMFPILLP